MLNAIRPLIRPVKRLMLGQRPFGLGELGNDTIVQPPHLFLGKQYVYLGDRCFIHPNSYFQAVPNALGPQSTPRIEIGNDVYIGRYAYLAAANAIIIGAGTVLSEHVYITDLNHGYQPDDGLIMKQKLQSKGPVNIGPNCFLGFRSCVMPGVTLGQWCIVGANSVVTRSFQGYSMVAGAPAELIKVYSHSTGKWVTPK